MAADEHSPAARWRPPPRAPPREEGGAARRGLWDTRAVLAGPCGAAAARSGHRLPAGPRAAAGRRLRAEPVWRDVPGERAGAPPPPPEPCAGYEAARTCGRHFRQAVAGRAASASPSGQAGAPCRRAAREPRPSPAPALPLPLRRVFPRKLLPAQRSGCWFWGAAVPRRCALLPEGGGTVPQQSAQPSAPRGHPNGAAAPRPPGRARSSRAELARSSRRGVFPAGWNQRGRPRRGQAVASEAALQRRGPRERGGGSARWESLPAPPQTAPVPAASQRRRREGALRAAGGSARPCPRRTGNAGPSPRDRARREQTPSPR